MQGFRLWWLLVGTEHAVRVVDRLPMSCGNDMSAGYLAAVGARRGEYAGLEVFFVRPDLVY